MLLNSHQLDDIVATFCDVWDDVVCKFSVAVEARFFSTHAWVCLVDEWCGDVDLKLVFPLVGLLWLPDLGAVVVGFFVLDSACEGGGEAVTE